MQSREIKTMKVPGGIGSDAWEASVEVANGGFHARAKGRGETRQDARARLGNSLHEMMREFAAIYAEIQTGK